MPASTENQTIKCKAAVLWGPKQPLSLEEIEVAPPKAGEVRIKILFTSLCQTDLHTQRGRDIFPFFTGDFPVILGHEATGVVESIGEGVTGVKPGDTVIPCFVPQCGKCAHCKRPDSNMCEANAEKQAKGLMPDGTTRFTCRGKPVYHFMGTSTFSEYTVCAEANVCKIDPKAQLDKVCIIGCGFCTGYGAAVETCKVREGSSVAVWGLGGVGLSVIAGAKVCGAKTIVGIDLNEDAYEKAKRMGATNYENPHEFPAGKSFIGYLQEKYGGGFDYTFECIGNPKTMLQALEASHVGWGVACMLGVADHNDVIPAPPYQIIQGRRWVGCIFGGYKGRDQSHGVPAVVRTSMEDGGKILAALDELIGTKVSFSEINKAFEIMTSGEGGRTIISVGSGRDSESCETFDDHCNCA